MGTGGGGGGGRVGGAPCSGGDARGGVGEGRNVRARLFGDGKEDELCDGGVDLAGAEQELLPAPSPPRPAWQKAWTSAGNTWSEDPMSHYLSDGGQLSEMWELYIQFDGAKFVQKSMERSDIRYLNLLSIMEAEGYGLCDSLYYVKDEGQGLHGLDLIDSNLKVDEMLRKYDSSKKVVLTVMRDKRNRAIVLSPLNRKNPIHIDLDPEVEVPIACQFETQNSVYYESWHTQQDEHIPYQFQTQDSVYCQNKNKHRQIEDEEIALADEVEEASDDSASWAYPCKYDPVAAEELRRKEEEELHNTIAEMRRRKKDPMQHCEGETDVEDIFDSQVDAEDIQAVNPVKKKVKRQGPTSNSHSQVQKEPMPGWAPSDEEEEQGFLKEEDDDGYEPLAFILPSGRKSRAKKAKERVWYDETRANPEQQFMVSLCFKDVYQFREALLRLHIVQVRNFHYHRNCPDRIIVWCKERDKYGCQFYMTASEIKHEKTFCIKKMHLEHICPTEPASSRVNSKWLSTAYVDTYRSDINTGITSLHDKAKTEFGVDVPKRMAYRARKKAQEMVMGDHKKQYHRLRDYLQTVIDKNPGSRCIVTTVTGPTKEQMEAMNKGQMVDICQSPRFHGLFFCVNAAREGFVEGCRPFIGLDGCFIKLTSGAQILAATGRDGNNIFPVAWAIVAKEDTDNWTWFLEQLKYALGGEQGKFGYYTIMSDRQKGLLKAVSTVFPNCPQRYCLRHIYANFQTAGFMGEDLKKCMDNAAYSYTQDGFDHGMEEMKKQCELAWAWLSKIPVSSWARWAMDTNYQTELVVNNLSEVFNKYILDVRNKPVVTMLVGIYDKCMVRWDGKREGAHKAGWEITPHYAERLEMMKKYSRDCIPQRSDLGLWQVQSGKVTHEVNIATRSCSCRKWQMTGLPCNHAISAIYKARQHPEDFVSDFFKKPMYLKSYSPVFYPMPAQHGWTKTNTPDIMPPAFKDHLKGRRQEKRRKGKFEVPKPKDTSRMATITCSNCKLQGHKYTSCSMPLRPDLAIRKDNHKARRSMPEGTSSTPGARPDHGATASSTSGPINERGVMSYLTAGANAGAGRDSSVGPLDGACSYFDVL